MEEQLDPIVEFLRARSRLLVLTGAGVSTGSGIPDYRGPDGAWKRRRPMLYQEFTGSLAARKRYWARSFTGWPLVAQAQPNEAHAILADWQHSGRLQGLITQNVDGLHEKAGAQAIDLHGRLDRVVCLDCSALSSRAALQAEFRRLNPDWQETTAADVAPDGDADLGPTDYAAFSIVDCDRCGGVLKPDVVFFGEAVPKPRVTRCLELLDAADGLLVIGSSVMVFSGFRFVRGAHRAGKPVMAINAGQMRGEELLSSKLDAEAGAALAAISSRLNAAEKRAAAAADG